MKPKIVQKPSFKVVGLSLNAKKENSNVEIFYLWQMFEKRIHEIKYKVNENSLLGIYHGWQSTKKENEFNFAACVEVTNLEDIPQNMVSKTIEAQTYAVFTVLGSWEEIQKLEEEIWEVWLPKSGLQRIFTPYFEVFDERFNSHTRSGFIDLTIPVIA